MHWKRNLVNKPVMICLVSLLWQCTFNTICQFSFVEWKRRPDRNKNYYIEAYSKEMKRQMPIWTIRQLFSVHLASKWVRRKEHLLFNQREFRWKSSSWLDKVLNFQSNDEQKNWRMWWLKVCQLFNSHETNNGAPHHLDTFWTAEIRFDINTLQLNLLDIRN